MQEYYNDLAKFIVTQANSDFSFAYNFGGKRTTKCTITIVEQGNDSSPYPQFVLKFDNFDKYSWKFYLEFDKIVKDIEEDIYVVDAYFFANFATYIGYVDTHNKLKTHIKLSFEINKENNITDIEEICTFNSSTIEQICNIAVFIYDQEKVAYGLQRFTLNTEVTSIITDYVDKKLKEEYSINYKHNKLTSKYMDKLRKKVAKYLSKKYNRKDIDIRVVSEVCKNCIFNRIVVIDDDIFSSICKENNISNNRLCVFEDMPTDILEWVMNFNSKHANCLLDLPIHIMVHTTESLKEICLIPPTTKKEIGNWVMVANSTNMFC